MLTFLCEDFEEINLEVQQKNNKMSDGVVRNLRGTASFQVKCIHDGQNYSATFLTSEMDKVRQCSLNLIDMWDVKTFVYKKGKFAIILLWKLLSNKRKKYCSTIVIDMTIAGVV